MNIPENSDVELFVSYQASDDQKVSWYCNNKPLEPSDDCIIQTESDHSRIKIKSADKKKVGKFEVVIQSNNLITKSASTVKIVKPSDEQEIIPPVFIRPVHSKEVTIGALELFETEVKSIPNASFQWFIGTKDVISYAKENKLKSIYVTNKDNVSCLCIENMTPDLVDIITCRAENFAGSVSCSASLVTLDKTAEIVGYAPEIIEPLQSALIMDGEPIVLTCKVKGVPWPKIDWYQDKKLLEKARDVAVARQESGLCELNIKEAFPEMSGTYECVATNVYGSCVTECIVTVEGSEVVPAYDCMLYFKHKCMKKTSRMPNILAIIAPVFVSQTDISHTKHMPCICVECILRDIKTLLQLYMMFYVYHVKLL